MPNAIYQEQRELVSGLRHAFWAVLNNSADSKLAGAILSKLCCVIYLNILLP